MHQLTYHAVGIWIISKSYRLDISYHSKFHKCVVSSRYSFVLEGLLGNVWEYVLTTMHYFGMSRKLVTSK